MSRRDLFDCLIHLRLNFQFFLSPIFLWGYLLAGGALNLTLIIAYAAFHFFGYAGGTAFNSYYDRDTGPIGGLEHPPPIPQGLLPFSIMWQVAGLFLALAVNLPFAAIYAIMFILSLAYSHPRTRFKGRPVAALATVAIGQGILGCLGGWATARGELASVWTPVGVVGTLAVTLLTVGFYPLTEIYQIDEDRERGDKTLAVWLGPAKSFRMALFCLALGGVSAVWLVALRYTVIEAFVLAVFLSATLAAVWLWSRSFQECEITRNFHVIMRLYAATSLGFIAWISLHLIRVL